MSHTQTQICIRFGIFCFTILGVWMVLVSAFFSISPLIMHSFSCCREPGWCICRESYHPCFLKKQQKDFVSYFILDHSQQSFMISIMRKFSPEVEEEPVCFHWWFAIQNPLKHLFLKMSLWIFSNMVRKYPQNSNPTGKNKYMFSVKITSCKCHENVMPCGLSLANQVLQLESLMDAGSTWK